MDCDTADSKQYKYVNRELQSEHPKPLRNFRANPGWYEWYRWYEWYEWNERND